MQLQSIRNALDEKVGYVVLRNIFCCHLIYKMQFLYYLIFTRWVQYGTGND